jgi:hypothetical protein
VLARDPGRVRLLLAGATDAERGAWARELKSFLAEPGTGDFMARLRLTQTFGFVAAVAGLAGARTRVQRALAGLPGEYWQQELGADYHAGYDAVAGVLADRQPPWLAEVVDALLRLAARERGWVDAWQLARRLVRLEAISRPNVPEYASLMVTSVFHTDGEPLPLVALLGDPGLLDEEVWRLFTEPSVAQVYALDENWADALAVLAGRGLLDRGRLLDECLGAFLRGFSPKHVGWYVTLHERLAPAHEEMAARSSLYLALLAAPGRPGVLLGERVSVELMECGLLEASAFLAASGPALQYPQKSVAIAHLGMVARIAAAHPELRELALATAAQAFANEREDVQAAALKLIRKYGLPASARAAIAELAGMLSPALGPEAAAAGVAVSFPVEGVPADGARAVARLGAASGAEEVVLRLGRLLEDASDALALERTMAGMVRLASLPVSERARIAAPLLKRARKVSEQDPDAEFRFSLTGAVAWLTLTWATGELPAFLSGRGVPESGREILYARLWEACELIASGASGASGPLLAEPEFTDGSISASALLERVGRWSAFHRAVPRYDLEMALLRLAPGADDASWLPSETARRMYEEGRQALTFEPVIIPPGTLWGRDPVIAARLVGAPLAGQSRSWRLLTDMSGDDDEYGAVNSGAGWEEDVAALPFLTPHQPELIAANLLWPLSDGLRQRSRGSAAAIRCLSDLSPDLGPVGFIGHVALVTALSSSKADKRIAAAEAWSRWAADGRLDVGQAAEAIRFGVAGSVFPLNRIGEALGYAIPSFITARCCVAATAALLDSRPDSRADLRPGLRPAGLHLLLEVAARVAAVSAVPELPASVAALSGEGTSKLAEAARRLSRLV